MGGRGAKFGVSQGKWSEGLGFQDISTLREALGTKGKEKSIGDSVVGTNPNYNGDYREFSANCQRCVVAYELRRRGYDVEAQATYKGDSLSRIAYTKTNGTYEAYWKGAFRHAKTEMVGVNGNNKKAEEAVLRNIEKKMKSYGNGSRAVVQIFYRGQGGHVFNVENQNGRICYVEAQVGRLKDVATTMHHVDTSSVNLIRVDNLKISERAKKFVKQSKK